MTRLPLIFLISFIVSGCGEAHLRFDDTDVDSGANNDSSVADGAIDAEVIDADVDGEIDAAIDAEVVLPDAAIDAEVVLPDADIDAEVVLPDAAIDAEVVLPDADIDAEVVLPDAAIDPCMGDPCAPGACMPSGSTYACTCPVGYEGETNCTDINECDFDACDALTACSNSNGSFSCGACPTGYTGTGETSCIDINECEILSTCGPTLTCENVPGGFACVCNGDEHLCDAECVLNASVDSCGSACTACPTSPHGTATCDGTSCGLTCNVGYLLIGGACVDATYIKASNPGVRDYFGSTVRISRDGSTLVVAAPSEDSNATTVNGDQTDNSAVDSGAVYVYARDGATWVFEAYLKASNAGAGDAFGQFVDVSSDGSTIAVGAYNEDSNAPNINGDGTNNSASNAGAVYVFRRTAGAWAQEAYIKSPNPQATFAFGHWVALSGDGNTLAVASIYEWGTSTGIGGNPAAIGASTANSGAVFVLTRTGSTWAHSEYLKASNRANNYQFGTGLAISEDGNTLVAGSWREAASGGSQSGAAYIFERTDGVWSQQAYLKAANSEANDWFGIIAAISGDGNTVAICASGEDSNATGVGGDQTSNSATDSGAVYVYRRSDTTWSLEAYVKASNTGASDGFCTNALSNDGSRLFVGAPAEDSNAVGLGGDQTNNVATDSGAVYEFRRSGTTWSQITYLKPPVTRANTRYGESVSFATDTARLLVGAHIEDGNSVGVGGDPASVTLTDSGAAYVYSADE